MATDNHTPIPEDTPANTPPFNLPLEELDAAIGVLTSLGTTTKSSLVAAIGTDGLDGTQKATLIQAINEVYNETVDLWAAIGDGVLADLGTTTKSSLVAAIGTDGLDGTQKATLIQAINEAYNETVDIYTAIGNVADLTTTATTVVTAINELDAGAMTPATLADAAADNGTLYYSSTANKLVYKDSGGNVHALY